MGVCSFCPHTTVAAVVLLSLTLSFYIFFARRDVDALIEAVESSIEFFRSLSGDGNGEGGDDGFVPFV